MKFTTTKISKTQKSTKENHTNPIQSNQRTLDKLNSERMWTNLKKSFRGGTDGGDFRKSK